MLLADFEGFAAALPVDQDISQHRRPAPQLLHIGRQIRLPDPADHVIEGLAVPPTVHVGFACAEIAVGENPVEQRLVSNLHVPGPIAVKPDIGTN